MLTLFVVLVRDQALVTGLVLASPPFQPVGAAVLLHITTERNEMNSHMRQLTLAETADYFEHAVIETTHDTGHALIHIGRTGLGLAFVMVNNMFGGTAVSESM